MVSGYARRTNVEENLRGSGSFLSQTVRAFFIQTEFINSIKKINSKEEKKASYCRVGLIFVPFKRNICIGKFKWISKGGITSRRQREEKVYNGMGFKDAGGRALLINMGNLESSLTGYE